MVWQASRQAAATVSAVTIENGYMQCGVQLILSQRAAQRANEAQYKKM